MISAELFDEICRSITSAPSLCGNTVIVTIDGPAGSGKTTLTKRLTKYLTAKGKSVATINTDDLYDGWEEALGEKLTKLLVTDVAAGVASGQTYLLPRFDWTLYQYSHPSIYTPADIVIVEGVGSGQKQFRPFVSVAIWIDIAEEIGLARVLYRDGKAISKHMERFLQDQKLHFAANQTAQSADYRVDGAP